MSRASTSRSIGESKRKKRGGPYVNTYVFVQDAIRADALKQESTTSSKNIKNKNESEEPMPNAPQHKGTYYVDKDGSTCRYRQ